MRIRSRPQSPRPRVGCAETWASSIDNCIIKAQSSGQNKRRAAPTHATLVIRLFDSGSHFAIAPRIARNPPVASAFLCLPPHILAVLAALVDVCKVCTSAAELALRIPCMTRSRVHYLRLCKGSYREQSFARRLQAVLEFECPF